MLLSLPALGGAPAACPQEGPGDTREVPPLGHPPEQHPCALPERKALLMLLHR